MPTETSKAYLHIYKRNCCFLLCLTTNMHFDSTACFASFFAQWFIHSKSIMSSCNVHQNVLDFQCFSNVA